MPNDATKRNIHYRSCCLCEAMCGLLIEYQGERVLSIKPDTDDVFSKGHICPKAVALQDIHNDPQIVYVNPYAEPLRAGKPSAGKQRLMR